MSRSRSATCLIVVALVSLGGSAGAGAQLPKHPENLRVLPETLSTDSVFALMLNVADALGVTCGYCHVNGDMPTWDSTNFSADVKRPKLIARAMFRLTNQLNTELLPATTSPGSFTVPVSCMTCHRGAPRPVTLADTLSRILERQGVDSLITAYQRFREHYADRMTYDLSLVPLSEIGSRLLSEKRAGEAVKVLELNARHFPNSADVAYQLGLAYEQADDKARAIAQFHKVLSIEPGSRQADRHLRALTGESKPPG